MVLFLLIFLLNHLSFAAEENDNLTANAGMSTFILTDTTVGAAILGSILLSYFTGGIGYHFNIVHNILAPGIYGDLHIGLLSFLSNNNEDYYEDNSFLLYQGGLRLYNQFRFGLIDIQPFFGLNLMGSIAGDASEERGLKLWGILMAYKNFGFEYSYQVPLKGPMINKKDAMQRIAFLYHLR